MNLSRESNNDEVSTQSSAWLDTDDERRSPKCELSTDEQIHIADLQWVDALLSNLSSRATDQRDARVRRVMLDVGANEPTPFPKRRFVRIKSAIAIAATLLVALSLIWTQFTRESHASIVLREIGEATLEKVDRICNLRRDASNLDIEQRAGGHKIDNR